LKFPEQFFRGRSGNFDLWDAKQDLPPAYRVEPASSEDVRVLLEAVKEAQCHFAIKSGVHARFAGASNAEGGVNIDMVRLNEIRLSSDKKSVTIGAGNRWMEVYRALEAEGLTVIGGRVADVGVGGLLLGGQKTPNASCLVEGLTASQVVYRSTLAAMVWRATAFCHMKSSYRAVQ